MQVVLFLLLVTVHCAYPNAEDTLETMFTSTVLSSDVTPATSQEKEIFEEEYTAETLPGSAESTHDNDSPETDYVTSSVFPSQSDHNFTRSTKKASLENSVVTTNEGETSRSQSDYTYISNTYTSSPYYSNRTTGFEPERTTQTLCDQIPKITKIIIAEAHSFNVTLRWEPPQNKQCVKTYVIYMNKDKYTTENNTLVIKELKACRRYKISIAVSNGTLEGERVHKYFNTTIPTPFEYPVTKLTIEEIGKELNVTWQPPRPLVSQCITNYNVTWRYNNDIQVNSTLASVSTLIPITACRTYEITVYPKIKNGWGSPQTETYTTRGFDVRPIENLTIKEIKSFSVSYQWYPPKNYKCVESYFIYLDDSLYRISNNTEILISNLTACQQYTIGVAASSEIAEGPIISQNFTTSTPNPFEYHVTNLKVEEIEKELNVTWQHPSTLVSQCVSNYYVTLLNEDDMQEENTTIVFAYDTNINSILIPVSACRSYVITVYPETKNQSGPGQTETYNTTGFDVPRIDNLTIETQSFSVSVQWYPPENYTCIKNYSVYLNDTEYQVVDDSKIVIPNLNACQEYKIGVAASSETAKGPTTSRTFVTNVPDNGNFSVGSLTFQETDNLTVSWSFPPETVLQCITSYWVEWGDTEDTQIETVALYEDYIEIPLIPCMVYTIVVYPQIYDMKGQPQRGSYTAKASPTSPPRIQKINPQKTSVTIKWEVDDPINRCPLKELVVTCNDSSTIESSIDINETNVMVIDELTPDTHYACLAVLTNIAGNSSKTDFKFFTKEEVPTLSGIRFKEVSSQYFVIEWSKPERNVTSYELVIQNEGANYPIADRCLPHHKKDYSRHVLNGSQLSFNFSNALSYYKYSVALHGTNKAGKGKAVFGTITTKASRSDPVPKMWLIESRKKFEYMISFDPPCYFNGTFVYYVVYLDGNRNGIPWESRSFQVSSQLHPSLRRTLKPECNYTISVRVVTLGFVSSPLIKTHETSSGVPILDTALKTTTVNVTTTSLSFKFSKNVFSDTNGRILYYALILSQSPGGDSGYWQEKWPTLPRNSHQLTPLFWNPFKDGVDEIDFVIGQDEECEKDYCNRPLEADTEYVLIVRGMTKSTYRDADFHTFRTRKQSKVGLIVGLLFGFLVVLGILLAILYYKRGKTLRGDKYSATSPAPIKCAKFGGFYETVSDNPNILKSQFAAIASQSKELAVTTSYGILPENRRKNRYTNILPYDHTRVKLQIDEDDEISSDYINASYIKGYSGKVEYIATQGPLESTCKDFWKMIIQENVSMIVMVTQFVEQSKEKCYQYFPNNHEKVTFGKSLDVRCSTELHFGTYCVRTLQVRKDTEQRNVIHVQFLEWPDFGVPQSTENVLELCHQMREKARNEGGLIVIHCSAGVGRTGTLIAIDILTQAIQRQHKSISIYKTVFELRKQRSNMVQTEKQYIFLHTCTRDYLQSPTVLSIDEPQDHTYENLDVLKSSLTQNLVDTESESIL